MRCALPKNLAFLIFFKGRNSTQCFVTIFSGKKSWTFFSLQSKLWMCWLIWVHATIIWEKPRQLIVNERHKSLGNRCIMPLQLHRNCLACLRNYWIFFFFKSMRYEVKVPSKKFLKAKCLLGHLFTGCPNKFWIQFWTFFQCSKKLGEATKQRTKRAKSILPNILELFNIAYFSIQNLLGHPVLIKP